MRLISIDKTNPKNLVTTEEIIDSFRTRLSDQLKQSIRNLNIEQRYCTAPSFLKSIQDKSLLVCEHSTTSLASESIHKSIENSGIDPKNIGLLVATTNTQSYILPGLGAAIVSEMNDVLDTSLSIVNMQGQGCSSLLKSIEVARWYLGANPNKLAVVVASEVQTPYSQSCISSDMLYGLNEIKKMDISRDEKKRFTQETINLIQLLLFADGAVSLIFGAGTGPTFKAICHETNMKREDFELLTIKDGGSAHPYLKGIPPYNMSFRVRKRGAEYAKKVVKLCLNHKDSPIKALHDASFYFIHTGSKKIIDGVCQKIGIDPADPKASESYEVLRKYANLSSASLGFMLENQFNNSKITGPGMLIAFGVGFSASASIFTP